MSTRIDIKSGARPRPKPVDVLHVPYCYFPDPSGGTEVYVAGLTAALRRIGVDCAVAAPGPSNARYEHEGTDVYRFVRSANGGLPQAHGAVDHVAAQSFNEILSIARPRTVHLHARTAAVSSGLMDAARRFGSKIVFTYHTPTVSCVRGTMMLMGQTACDGRLDRHRCTDCLLQSKGVPKVLRRGLSALPDIAGSTVAATHLTGGLFTALQIPRLVDCNHQSFRSFVGAADHVVAVCKWVADVLLQNGMSSSKVSICRQGITERVGQTVSTNRQPEAPRPLHIGYFGRLDETKGPDLLVSALKLIPKCSVRLSIYGIQQRGREEYARWLEASASADGRITLHPAVGAQDVRGAMEACDLVAIPSRWLETGPLVVLEAFGAGRPVLGARLGGIAELTTDGVDGVLVEPDEPRAWASAIDALSRDPARMSRMRAKVRAPRTMDDVSRDMASVYERVLALPGASAIIG